MSTNDLIKFYDELPKIAKILIQIFLGSLVSGIYRILRYLDSKNTSTLIAGILAFVPVVCVVFWILDLVAVVQDKKFSFMAD
jgi:hypothetical protein